VEEANVAETSDEPLAPAELEAVAARCAAATPGPWADHDLWLPWVCELARIAREHWPSEVVDATFTFVAHARADVPRLLATVAARDAEVERYKATVFGRLWNDGKGVRPPEDQHTLKLQTEVLHLRAVLGEIREQAKATDDSEAPFRAWVGGRIDAGMVGVEASEIARYRAALEEIATGAAADEPSRGVARRALEG
jgi:hypothetical protein